MLLLAIDTSGKKGSLALARVVDGHGEVKVLDVIPLAGGTFSAQLVPQIATLLAKHESTKSDIGAFAVASGPGSFTGLRVGLAAIKALAEVLQKPIAAVSILEAVARSSARQGRVLAALDAGRNEIYVGDYELTPEKSDGGQSKSQPRMYSERLLSKEEFLAEAKNSAVVTPEAGLAQVLLAHGIHCEQINRPDSGVIAHLGWEHIQRGQIVQPDDLEANYIRRSDAEIFSQPPR
jgi:tRNA threonylcarbamoyladenosine biosynthesis protein TsaB